MEEFPSLLQSVGRCAHCTHHSLVDAGSDDWGKGEERGCQRQHNTQKQPRTAAGTERGRQRHTHTHTHSTPLTGKHDQTDDKDETGVLQSRRSDASGDFDDVTEGKERVEHASKARKRPHCRPPPSGQRQWGRAGLPPPLQAPPGRPQARIRAHTAHTLTCGTP